jgi:hypothetical protein
VTQQDVLTGEFPIVPPGPESVAPLLGRVAPVGPHVGAQIGPGLVPRRFGGNAAYTAEAVKQVLLQPRMQLIWSINGLRVLQSPIGGFLCDSSNGPKPVSCDVVEIHSGKTFLVDWTVQTDISPCPLYTSTPDPVLSNQWTQEDTLDEDFLVKRTTRGRTIFDAAILAGINPGVIRDAPDSFRQLIILPITASNMKRESVRVKVLEDGVTVEWETVDKETFSNFWLFADPNITRVEATHSVKGYYAGGATTITSSGRLGIGAPAGLPIDAGISTSIGRSLTFSPGEAAAARRSGAYSPATLALIDIVQGNAVVLSQHTIWAKVWGNRQVLRNNLEAFIRQLIVNRLAPLLPLLGFDIETEIIHNVGMNGNTVEAHAVYVGGPLSGSPGMALPLRATLPSRLGPTFTTVFGPTNDSGIFAPVGGAVSGVTQRSGTQLVAPPFDSVSRGTMLIELITAALSTPCNRQMNWNRGISVTTPFTPGTLPLASASLSPSVSVSPPSWPKPAPFVPPQVSPLPGR